MAADIDFRAVAGASYGVIEGRPIGHDGRAGQNSFAERAQDALIHAGRKSEVIRVDDQCFHWSPELVGRK